MQMKRTHTHTHAYIRIQTHTPIQLCPLIRIFIQIVKLLSQESNKQVLLATNCSMNAKCKQMQLSACA